MKIGMFIPEFPGQTHSFFWREIEALRARHGIEAEIISTRLPPRPVLHDWVGRTDPRYLYPVGAVRLVLLGLRLLPLLPRLLGDAETRRILRQPRNWAFVLMAIRLADLRRELGAEHLHAHSCANAALIAAFCERLFGMRYSLTLHGALRDYGPYQDFKWRHAAFGFVVSEKLKEELTVALPEARGKMRVAPMGVDTDRFAPPADPRSDEPEVFRWFCCGRLNRGKGHDVLLAAADHLRREDPSRRFSIRIAGEDEEGGSGYRLELEAEIARLGLADTVTLIGAVSEDRVLRELQSCDGFVLATRHEALGVAYMEAMACALPVIGTRTGGVHELIEDGREGILVPVDAAGELAGAMRSLMGDPDMRRSLGRAARQKIVTTFGASRSADALAQELSGSGNSRVDSRR